MPPRDATEEDRKSFYSEMQEKWRNRYKAKYEKENEEKYKSYLRSQKKEELFEKAQSGIGKCWKEDQDIVIELLAEPEEEPYIYQMIPDTQLDERGVLAYIKKVKVTSGDTSEYEDEVFIEVDTCVGEKVKEYFCAYVVEWTSLKPYDWHTYQCPTGKTCLNGRCMKIASNGCPDGVSPFLNVTDSGDDDSCLCPEGSTPIDLDGNGMSDNCLWKEMDCPDLSAKENASVYSVKDTLSGTLQKVTNQCVIDPIDPEKTTHTVSHFTCSDVGKIVSSSTTVCPSQMICIEGICSCEGGTPPVCDDQHVDLSSEGFGYVLVNGQDVGDFCDASDSTRKTVQNATCGTCGKTEWVESKCADNALCLEAGVCTVPAAPPTDCISNPDDPNCADGEDEGCIPDKIELDCSLGEDNDPPNPDKSPTQDVHLYGVVTMGINKEGCDSEYEEFMNDLLGGMAISWKEDNCFPHDPEPMLLQYSCSNGNIIGEETTPCPDEGEACNPFEMQPDLRGICKPYDPPQCEFTGDQDYVGQGPEALDFAGSVDGEDGFHHPFHQTDHCISSNVVKKFFCTGEGLYGFYFEYVPCQNDQTCDNGVCTEPLEEQDKCAEPEFADGPFCTDQDVDTVVDAYDNCPTVKNGPEEAGVPGVGNQLDSNSDGIGDACEEIEPEEIVEHTCYDSDEDNDPEKEGYVHINKDSPQPKYLADFCLAGDVVMEIGCGPQNKDFVKTDVACPAGTSCNLTKGKCE